MSTRLLFISNNVKDIHTIINNLLPDVKYVIIKPDESRSAVKLKIDDLNLSDLSSIGLMFDNIVNRIPFIEYTESEKDIIAQRILNTIPETIEDSITVTYNDITSSSDIQNQTNRSITEYLVPITDENSVEVSNTVTSTPWTTTVIETRTNPAYIPMDMHIEYDFIKPDTSYTSGYKFISQELMQLLTELKAAYSSLSNIDIISCSIPDHEQFSSIPDITVNKTNSIIGGQNWVLGENRNLIDLYFTETIRNYKYKLGGIAPLFNVTLNCYEIITPDNLYWLMTYATNIGAPPNLSSTFCITQNIDMTGYGFPSESIAKNTAITDRFTGILNGNNNTVTIDSVVSTYRGFFDYFADGATATQLYNLNLVYKQNTYTLNGASNNLYFGFLIGTQAGGTCTNCTVSFSTVNPITVTLNNNTSGNFTSSFGGLIGIMLGVRPICTGCSINVTVPMTIEAYGQRGIFIGGGFGQAVISGQPSPLNLGIFQNTVTYNTLTLRATKIASPAGAAENNIYAAGFIGYCLNSTATNDYIYVNNNMFSCQTLTINDTITGITGNVTFTAAGFCGYSFASIFNNNTSTIQLYNVQTTKISTQFISGAFGQIISNNVTSFSTQILNSVYTIGTFNINSSTTLTGIVPYMNGFCSSSSGNSKISGITLTITSMNCYIPSSLVTISGNCFVSGFFGSSSLTTLSLFEISNITCNIGSISLITEILSYSIFFGGFIAQVGTLEVCNTLQVNIGTIDIQRRLLSPAAIISANHNIGGFAGTYRGNLSASSIIIGTTNVNLDTSTSSLVGGLIGFYSYAGTLPSVSIQNNTFSITTLNIISTALLHNNPRTIYLGGFIGQFGTLPNTQSRNINNNTINIDNFTYNSSRTVAVVSTANSSLGGLFGITFESNIAQPTWNPININNLTATIKSLEFNTTNTDGTTVVGSFIGTSYNRNFIVINSTLTYLTHTMNINTTNGMITYGGINGASTAQFAIPNNTSRGSFNNLNVTFNTQSIRLTTVSPFFLICGGMAANLGEQRYNGCNISVGSNSFFQLNNPGFAYIGLLFGSSSRTVLNTNTTINNRIILQDTITMQANPVNRGGVSMSVLNLSNVTPVLTNLTNKAYIRNTTYELVFNTDPIFSNLPTSVIADGISYQLFPIPNTTKTSTGYMLTYSQFTLIFFFEEIVPVIPITCCTANICDANPQTANQDSSTAIQSQSGQQLVSAVNDFYAAAARGQIRPNAPPIFKTYGQMMEWKQRQNRR